MSLTMLLYIYLNIKTNLLEKYVNFVDNTKKQNNYFKIIMFLIVIFMFFVFVYISYKVLFIQL